MEKEEYEHTKHTGISKNERLLLDLLSERDSPTSTIADIRRMSGWPPTRIHNTLHALTRKNILTIVSRGHYAPTDSLAEHALSIATSVIQPSYISFWTALSLHGFTDQQVNEVQVVSTKQHADLTFNAHRVTVTTYKPRRFYGYSRREDYVIAEPEKTLVDALYQPQKCGGFDEVAACLAAAKEAISERRLADYLIRFKNKSLVSRAGHLLERLGYAIPDTLVKHRSQGYVKLTGEDAPVTRYDHRWKVAINHRFTGDAAP